MEYAFKRVGAMLSITDQIHERLLKILGDRIKLPSMTVTGMKLLQLLQRPLDTLEVREIASLVEQDPVLTARVLRIANSPSYGGLRAISGVKQALVTIGLDEAVSALNYFLIRKMMPKVPPIPYFNSQAFWKHAVACGTAARMLGNPNYDVTSLPGELYLAGLLHDIGKLMLAIYMPEDFGRILELAHSEKTPLYRVENAFLGVDHALIGAHLLDEWRLPPHILDAVCFHHNPWGEDLAERNELALLVHFADRVVNEMMTPLAEGNDAAPAQSGDCDALRAGLGALASEDGWRHYLGSLEQRLARHASEMDAAAAPARQGGGMQTASAECKPVEAAAKTPSLWSRIMGWFGR